jgi:hypothetical protein
LQENREVINTWFKCLARAMKKPGSKNAMDHADKAASMELKMTKKSILDIRRECGFLRKYVDEKRKPLFSSIGFAKKLICLSESDMESRINEKIDSVIYNMKPALKSVSVTKQEKSTKSIEQKIEEMIEQRIEKTVQKVLDKYLK